MPWVIAAILAAFLGYFGGFQAGLVGFAMGLAIGYVIQFSRRSAQRRKASTEDEPVSSLAQQPEPAKEVQGKRPPSEPLEWIGPNQQRVVHGFRLNDGMIYQAKSRLPWPGEPSAIDPTLKVEEPARGEDAKLGYYSHYSYLTPAQRGAYLEWLSQGRRDLSPGERDLGYVFLFFYGLERRILIDGDPHPVLRKEIFELLNLYSPFARSRSLQNYFLELLHFSGYREGTETYRQNWPLWLQAYGARLDGETVKLVLANLFERSEPMHWTVAWHLASRLESSQKSVVVERTGEKFWKLFEQRFEESYPGGMQLKSAKQKAWVEYHPASSALLNLAADKPNTFRIQVPNIMGSHSQFNKIADIWNSCVKDLSGFSRALAHKTASPDEKALLAYLKLPEEVRDPGEHPLAGEWTELLNACEREDTFFFVPVASVSAMFGFAERDNLTAAQGRRLSEHVNSLGYQLAPDPRITGVPLMWNQELAVYHLSQSYREPSLDLSGVLRMLYLTVSVAAADGIIDQDEVAVFERTALETIHDNAEKEALEATGAVLLRDATIADKALTRIARSVRADRRELVARYAIQVAAADGLIAPGEARLLKRIFRLFELPANFLERQVADDQEAFGEVTVQKSQKTKDPGSAIPPKPDQPNAFHIDMSKVAAITAETSEVIGVLSAIMDNDSENESGSRSTTSTSEPAAVSQYDGVPWMEGLEIRYRAALQELVQQGEFTQEHLSATAARNHLMPLDLVDTVNAWADEALGDFLIDDQGDRFVIYLDLIPANDE